MSYLIRRNGRLIRLISFADAQGAIDWLADRTGIHHEVVAESTRGEGKLVDDNGDEWTVEVQP